MKRTLFVMALLALVFSACTSAPRAVKGANDPASATQIAAVVEQQQKTAALPEPGKAPEGTPPGPKPAEAGAPNENARSVGVQLLLGTFKLEGTDLAVTKEQAVVLLPLWKEFKTLSESLRPAQGGAPGEPGGQQPGQANATPQPMPTLDDASQAKTADLIQRIQAAMTAEQLKAIADLKITREAVTALLEELDIQMGGPQGQGGSQPPGGGQPPSGGQPPAGGAQSGTPQAPGLGGEDAGFIPPELIDTLISLLEKK